MDESSYADAVEEFTRPTEERTIYSMEETIDKIGPFVSLNNQLAELECGRVQYIPLSAFIDIDTNVVCCTNHMAPLLTEHLTGIRAPFLVYRHVRRATDTPDSAYSYEYNKMRTAADVMDHPNFFRLCEIVPADAAGTVPFRRVPVIHRKFACAKHYMYATKNMWRLRQLFRNAIQPVLGCATCCPCEAALLFREYGREQCIPESSVLVLQHHPKYYSSTNTVDKRFMSDLFGSREQEIRQSALMWFFGGVRNPNKIFWECVSNLMHRKKMSLIDALWRIHDESYQMWELSTRYGMYSAYDTVRMREVRPMLEAGKMYLWAEDHHKIKRDR